jgi:hypothetical protein
MEITFEQFNKAMGIVRESFNEMNKEFYAELERSKKTGSFRFSTRTIHYGDLKDYHEILENGFQSLDLHQLFETLIYLYFFKTLCTSSLDLNEFVSYDKFDNKQFFKEIRHDLNLIISINILEAWTIQTLQMFNIKKTGDVLGEGGKHLEKCIDALLYGKKRALHHYGNNEFIVSKMEFEASNGMFDTKIVAINPNVFYTSSPTQILNFVRLAKPGIYVVANVPPNAYQDSAFYIIFRQEKYAYIVENNKHSYREQFYRTDSHGNSGQDRFLGMKYEHTYLPIQMVLDFMEKKSKSTEVLDKQVLDFISLGNLFDCCPEIVLWHYGFIDTCIQRFLNEEFVKQIEPAASFKIMKSELTDPSLNLPAIYKASIPQLTSLDLSWSSEKVGTDDIVTGTFLDKLRPAVPLAEIPEPSAKVTSVGQIHREFIFNKRKQEAILMQEAINKDFIEHYEEVKRWIINFIHEKGIIFLAKKGLKDLKYSTDNLKPAMKPAMKPAITDNLKLASLYGIGSGDGGSESILIKYDPKNPLSYKRAYYSHRCFQFTPLPFRGKTYCDCCKVFVATQFHILSFKEYSQFKTFFEIEDDSKVPEQLRTYLSKKVRYHNGNSILDDIDPVALLHIPWWRTYLRDEGLIADFSPSDGTILPIRFNLCKRCRNKIEKNK